MQIPVFPILFFFALPSVKNDRPICSPWCDTGSCPGRKGSKIKDESKQVRQPNMARTKKHTKIDT